jgi:hypothetical protein
VGNSLSNARDSQPRLVQTIEVQVQVLAAAFPQLHLRIFEHLAVQPLISRKPRQIYSEDEIASLLGLARDELSQAPHLHRLAHSGFAKKNEATHRS